MKTRLFFSISLLIIGYQEVFSQNSMGIGTETPNSHAVLELVSPQGNQGLLVPRLTTAQRVAQNFTSGLGIEENGLLVYDSDESQFYYWAGSVWKPVSSQELLDNDPANEIQDLELTSNLLSLTSDDTPVDLSPYLDNTDAQLISYDPQTGLLSLTNGGSVDLSVLSAVDDADADSTNELQSLTFSGTILNTSKIDAPVDLSVLLDNTDEQALSYDSQSHIVTLANGGEINLSGLAVDNVNDADADPANEIQDISLSGSSLAISGGSTIDLSVIDTDTQLGDADISTFGYIKNADDADADPANEIQDLSLAGTTLSITNNPSATLIDLSPFQGTNTDNQDLSLSENTLSLTNDATSVDLSIYLDNTDAQTLSFAGTSLSISNGNAVDLSSIDTDTQLSDAEIAALGYVKTSTDGDADPSNEVQVLTAGTGINLAQSGINYTVTNSAPDQVVTLIDGGSGNVTISGTYPNLTVDVPSLADGDANPGNEIQDLQFINNQITLSNDPGATIIDLGGFDTDGSDEFSGSWNDLTNIPADIADGDANTQLSDADITSLGFIKSGDLGGIQTEITTTQTGAGLNADGTFAANAGANYISAATSLRDADNLLDAQVALNSSDITVNTSNIAANTTAVAADNDGDPTNEYQDLQFSSGLITLSNDPTATAIDLSNYDSNASDDFDGNFSSLTGIPSGLSDGDQDTQLTEAEVDAFANNNGYLTSYTETDPSVPANLKDGVSWTEVSGKPSIPPSNRTDFKYIGAQEFEQYEDTQTAGSNANITIGASGSYGFIQIDVVESTGKIAAPFEVPNGSTIDQVIITASNVKGTSAQVDIIAFPFGAAEILGSTVPKPLNGGSITIDKGLADYGLTPGVQVDNTTSQYLVIATVGSGTTLNIYQIRVRYSFSY